MQAVSWDITSSGNLTSTFRRPLKLMIRGYSASAHCLQLPWTPCGLPACYPHACIAACHHYRSSSAVAAAAVATFHYWISLSETLEHQYAHGVAPGPAPSGPPTLPNLPVVDHVAKLKLLLDHLRSDSTLQQRIGFQRGPEYPFTYVSFSNAFATPAGGNSCACTLCLYHCPVAGFWGASVTLERLSSSSSSSSACKDRPS